MIKHKAFSKKRTIQFAFSLVKHKGSCPQARKDISEIDRYWNGKKICTRACPFGNADYCRMTDAYKKAVQYLIDNGLKRELTEMLL
jgi:hypothetical protein